MSVYLLSMLFDKHSSNHTGDRTQHFHSLILCHMLTQHVICTVSSCPIHNTNKQVQASKIHATPISPTFIHS